MIRILAVTLAALVSAPPSTLARESDPLVLQQAVQAAAREAAPSTVQIQTVGGLDPAKGTPLPTGPTTGVVVSTEGHVVSSLFNFAQDPASILVKLHDGQRVPARIIARDTSRMLALLKAETTRPTIPAVAVPAGEARVGWTAVAIGRTFQEDQPDVSVGIVSALSRMHGRVLQTDANVSPANYGGPLVDLRGRVLGVLVPMSPTASSEIAGVEFYDSGIGFAVPLTHVYAVLEKWKSGDIHPGRLGIGLKKGSEMIDPPEITSVWPGSPAAGAGIQEGDVVTAINGRSVGTQNQLRRRLAQHYAGETVSLTLDRSGETLQHSLKLLAQMPSYRRPALGIVPDRDAEAVGVAVRGVLPGSPAAQAGVLRGDVVQGIGQRITSTVEEAASAAAELAIGEPVDLLVDRAGEPLTLPCTPAAGVEALPISADIAPRQPRNTDSPPEWEESPVVLTAFAFQAKAYAPKKRPSRPIGLCIWLASDDDSAKQLLRLWKPFAERDRMAVVVAHPPEGKKWLAEDAPYLKLLVRSIRMRMLIDPQRFVLAGSGTSGQLACSAGVRGLGAAGVVLADAPLPRTLKLPEASPSRQLSVLFLQPEDSPLRPLVEADARRLREKGHLPTLHTSRSPAEGQLSTISRWIDALDRF